MDANRNQSVGCETGQILVKFTKTFTYMLYTLYIYMLFYVFSVCFHAVLYLQRNVPLIQYI